MTIPLGAKMLGWMDNSQLALVSTKTDGEGLTRAGKLDIITRKMHWLSEYRKCILSPLPATATTASRYTRYHKRSATGDGSQWLIMLAKGEFFQIYSSIIYGGDSMAIPWRKLDRT